MGKRLIVVCLAVPALVLALSRIPSTRAAEHVGEAAVVCGPVAEVYHAWRSRGQPTFLDFDAAYPNEDFTAVVWVGDAGNFGNLSAYQGTNVCARGVIRSYRGRPEIVARERGQLAAQ